MEHSTAQRRLVKSPPELWAEVSSEDTLGRHLAPFGEIRITRVEPETTVAWEGERASGTVELAPAGWGTKVILTAQQAERAPLAPDQPRHAGFLARLLRCRAAEAGQPLPALPELRAPALGPPPPLVPAPTAVPAPAPSAPGSAEALDAPRTEAILLDVLDGLGGVLRRPGSRD
jgi:hypothetical protein